MSSGLLDDLIRSALNDPLGDEEAPDWGAILRQTAPAAAPLRAKQFPRRAAGGERAWLVRLAALAALAAAAAVAVMVFPSRHPSLLQNAAAAMQGVGSGPVLHLVYASPSETIARLDVRTGAVRQERVNSVFEVWYDRTRHVFKEVRRSPVFSFTVWKSPREAIDSTLGLRAVSSVQVPPEVTLFSDYQQAIAQGKASPAGEGTADGHQVFFLWIYECVLRPFPGHPGSSLGCTTGSINTMIAIDKHTYLPVAIYPNQSGPSTNNSGGGIPILRVELLPRSAADLAKPPLPPPVPRDQFGIPQIASSRVITTHQATTWLSRRPVALRTTLAGLPLSVTLGDRLNPANTPRRRGLEVLYGSSCQGKPRYHGAYVLIQQGTTAEPAYNTNLTLAPIPPATSVLFAHAYSSYPECGAPNLSFYSGQHKAEQVWAAVLRTHGLDISIFSPRKTLAVRAIQELLRNR